MNAFAELLSPIERDQFFREHWGRRPLLIRGVATKFEQLPSLARLPAVMAGRVGPAGWTHSVSEPVQASFVDARGKFRDFTAPPGTWSQLFNAGISLCLGRLDRHDEALTHYANEFRQESNVGGTIAINGYLTPPHSGSAMHFDRQNVFFLQTSGEKHWTHGTRPAWIDPPLNIGVEILEQPSLDAQIAALGLAPIARPEETGMTTTILHAGDALYVPPGVWHEARTAEQHSLHYSLTFEPMNAWKAIYAFLRMHLLRQPSWRRDLRFGADGAPAPTADVMTAAVQALKDAVAQAKPEELLPLLKLLLPPDGSMNEFFGTK